MMRKATLLCAWMLSVLLLSPLMPVQNATAQDTTPVAADDFFNVKEDSTISVASPGLFFNDEETTDSLLIVLVDAPGNGTVTVNEDGSFDYTPNTGFNGVDSFTYLIQTVPMQVLEVDTTQSNLNFDMEVSILLGTDDDQASGRIGGQASFFLNPDNPPFNQAHLYDLDLTVIDSLNLEFKFGGLITLGRLFVDADTNAFKLKLSERGAPTEIIDGMFTQAANKVQVLGIVSLEGTGLIDGEVPEEPQELDTETEADITIEMSADGQQLTAQVPVLLEEAFELSGTDVDLKVDGMLLATGALKQPVQSNIATVSITVDPISRTDVDTELPFSYALSQNYPNPFNPVTTIAFSVPTAELVTLKVFDMLGREVASLIDGIQAPGIHEVQFNAAGLPSGMYIYKLEAKAFAEVKKLVLLK
ncbi:MAG: Ig-like domain-containing protein [Rhodothermales bacterium]